MRSVLDMCESQEKPAQLAALSAIRALLQHSLGCAAALEVSIETSVSAQSQVEAACGLLVEVVCCRAVQYQDYRTSSP